MGVRGGVGRNSPSPHITTPASTPQLSERKESLAGDLLALSGAEEGGKLILTCQGFFFFPAFLFIRPKVRMSGVPECTELGKK